MNKNLKQVINPYLPAYEYIPDGEPYVFGDRVYIYGSHDKYNGEVYCELDYVCWSAPVTDLGDWRYEGVIYRKNQDPSNADLQGNLYAPDVAVGIDGRYYLYYSLSNQSHVAVAVCDEPAGKYEFYGYVHYKDGTNLGSRYVLNEKGESVIEQHQFDPGVLREENRVYLYTGFCMPDDASRKGAMVTVLGPDMLTIEEEPEIIVPSVIYSKGTKYEGHAFFEASSIRERNGKYYFIYSSYLSHELCYATSDGPKGPFEYAGTIVSNCDIGIDTYKEMNKPANSFSNNHGSIVEIEGEWYIFYHRHTNGHNYSRQGCLELIAFDDAGMIKQVEMTSCGGKTPLVGKGVYPAYLACNLFTREGNEDNQRIPWIGWLPDTNPKITQSHSDVDADTEHDEISCYISNMRDGAVAGFKYFEISEVDSIAIRTKGYAAGKFNIYVSKITEPKMWNKVGEISVSSTNEIKRDECAVSIEKGVYALYFEFVGANNINFYDFELV